MLEKVPYIQKRQGVWVYIRKMLYIKYDHLHLFMYLLVYVITYIQQIISNNYMLELHVEILDRNKQYISTEAFQNFS